METLQWRDLAVIEVAIRGNKRSVPLGYDDMTQAISSMVFSPRINSFIVIMRTNGEAQCEGNPANA